MINRRKPRNNSRKRPKTGRSIHILGWIMTGFKVVAALVALVAVTAFFILIHDLVVQSEYFAIDQITIEGVQRLSRKQVNQQTDVHRGDNILSVKLATVRKKLLAHPWIAQAEVSREIPSRLIIRIEEHTALAAVDFGAKKYLINHQGQIFKAWDPAERLDVPVISGLALSDLKVFDPLRPKNDGRNPTESVPYRAVMQVLDLGKPLNSILPNHLISRIRVDRQIGLTVYAFDRLKAFSLGYSDYIGKYQMLEKLLAYLEQQRKKFDFNRIDLNNLQYIVVNPVNVGSSSESAGIEKLRIGN